MFYWNDENRWEARFLDAAGNLMNIQQKPRLQHWDERARCKSAAQMDSQQKLTHRDNGKIISGDIQREIATIKVSLALFPAWKRWKPLSATSAKSPDGQETPSHARRKLDLRRWVRTVFQAHSEEKSRSKETKQKLVALLFGVKAMAPICLCGAWLPCKTRMTFFVTFVFRSLTFVFVFVLIRN